MNDGKSLKEVAQLDTMVTVVDAFNFIDQYHSSEMEIQERKTRLQTHDQTSVVELMIDQLEFANVILVNKSNLVSPEKLEKIHQMIRAINAEAKIIDTNHGKVDLTEIMSTGSFDFEKAQEYPTWVKEIEREVEQADNSSHDHSHSHGHGLVHSHSHEFGLTSFVYRARKPFVPERIIDFMETPVAGLIRAKGYFWLCTRMDQAGNFQLAGKLKEYGVAGRWYSTIPQAEWTPDMKEFIEKEWVEPFGDRRQEIVFIGSDTDLDQEKITQQLDSCLISDDELEHDYSKFPDPFPVW